MKRIVFALFGLCLFVLVFLSAYRAPNLAAAAPVSAAASPTPAAQAPTPTPTVLSTNVDLATLILTALKKDATLGAYRADFLMTTRVLSPTTEVSPTVLADLHLEYKGNDAHVLARSDGRGPQEIIRVGDRLFVRDQDQPGSEKWFSVPPDQTSKYAFNSPLQAIPTFWGSSMKFSQAGVETLDGVQCSVYLQDRAAVAQVFLTAIGASGPVTPEQADKFFDRAESKVWVCADDYLHQLELHISTKPQSSSDIPVALDARIHLYDLNGDVQISAPANAVPLPSPTPVPSETPVFTPTPRPTAGSAQATATAVAAASVLKTASNWDVVLTDSFDSNSNKWTEGDGKSVAGGKYVWDMNNRVNVYRGLPEMKTQSDFAATIDARLVSGSPDCGMGLTFRNSTDPSYGSMTDYVFYIHNDQRWGFDIVHSPDPGIAQNGTSDAIVPQALNRIAVVAQGDQFTFFVNGKYVGQAQDKTLARGKIGAAVWVLGPGSCQVEFDNFQVRALPGLSAAPQGKTILTDWTASNPNKWQTGSYVIKDAAGKEPDATGTREIVGTHYRWQATSASEIDVFAAPATAPQADFDVSVDAQQTGGSQKNAYGLMFRHTDPDDAYFFSITGYGAYALSYNKAGEYQSLIFPTTSSAVKPGEVNHLRVIGVGSHFIFYVNDEIVAEIYDDALPQGTVGLGVEAYDRDNPGASFEFSNFVLREPPAAAAVPSAPASTVTPAVPAAPTPTATPTASATSSAQADCPRCIPAQLSFRQGLAESERKIVNS